MTKIDAISGVKLHPSRQLFFALMAPPCSDRIVRSGVVYDATLNPLNPITFGKAEANIERKLSQYPLLH